MPVSHSHQLLCVSESPLDTTLTRSGSSGLDTSQTSCAEVPYVRSRYTLPPPCTSHTRAICAPPPGSPGMCATRRGERGSVTSRIEVPLGSTLPLTGLVALPPWWPT